MLHGHLSPLEHSSPPRLAEWLDIVREFGEYYRLSGSGPITIDPVIYRDVAVRYGGAQQNELPAAPDRHGA